jgi:hypothetical protein
MARTHTRNRTRPFSRTPTRDLIATYQRAAAAADEYPENTDIETAELAFQELASRVRCSAGSGSRNARKAE